ncbi:MAG: hypothetical protein DSY66_02180 [Persephonella sp.]|nr:MAG: hypothetical protein DSY53_03635 [Persephonella sp.]RUM61418.1 MAG: hypothetical protein DSY66_02180 [Persephonella sp.]
MFRVDNLVFNKIGNSVSVMVFKEEKGLQIYDETDFKFNSFTFSLIGLTVKNFLDFYFYINTSNRKIDGLLHLSDKNSFLEFGENKFNVIFEDGEIDIKITDTDLIFKLSLGDFKHISFQDEILKIKEENMFKGIVEFFSVIQ